MYKINLMKKINSFKLKKNVWISFNILNYKEDSFHKLVIKILDLTEPLEDLFNIDQEVDITHV